MQRDSEVDFEEVRATFIRDNVETPERNDWPLGALEVANRQFGTWTRVVLFPDEVQTVMLPRHDHLVNLVPADGSTVSDAIKRLDLIDRSTECYQRVQQFLSERTPIVFLSAAPISDPRYDDYRGLVDRGYRGLTHLDGLHRLIAWGRENRRRVPAYVAGLA
jgi:hypothetical protein